MVQKPILVVDDDPDLLDLMEIVLSDVGYSVERASNGLEALSIYARKPAALILVDMRMPRMNGREFAAKFREMHDHEAPLILVTAAESALALAREIAAEGFLSKPFSIRELTDIAERYLRRL